MKITGKFNRKPSRYRRDIKKRLVKVRKAIGDKISASLVEEVRSKIPDQGGWFDIYRDAIRFDEDDGRWVVLGETSIELTQVPAETSLIVFSGNSPTIAALIPFNPFPVDTIPPVNGGITGTATVLASSKAEVMVHRERHADMMSDVEDSLRSQGHSINWSERPIINGEVLADLRFLSKRLEHGLGGFPRVPHWNPAKASARRKAGSWVQNDPKVINKIRDALSA